jgi:hypothetical protein
MQIRAHSLVYKVLNGSIISISPEPDLLKQVLIEGDGVLGHVCMVTQ